MYIKRGIDGEITAVSKEFLNDFTDWLEDDDKELMDFLYSLKTSRQQDLEESDLTMVRVLEDVINLLIEQNIIRFTDLPQPAQVKLLSRRKLRESVNLLDDEENLSV